MLNPILPHCSGKPLGCTGCVQQDCWAFLHWLMGNGLISNPESGLSWSPLFHCAPIFLPENIWQCWRHLGVLSLLYDDINRGQTCCPASYKTCPPKMSLVPHWGTVFQSFQVVPQSLGIFFPYLTSYLGRTPPISLECFHVCPSLPYRYHSNLFSLGLASLSDLDLPRVLLPVLWPGNTLRALNMRSYTLLIHFLFLWLSHVQRLINCVHFFLHLQLFLARK